MAFNKAVLVENLDLPAGEVIKASPHNVSAFDVFQDGLIEGRFAQYKAGILSNVDGTETPKIVGIVKRKVTGEIGTGVYTTSGEGCDSVAEVADFGYATVTIADGIEPAKYEAVNFLNEDTDERGKATNAAVADGIVSAGSVVFWEAKATGVWLVRMNKYL